MIAAVLKAAKVAMAISVVGGGAYVLDDRHVSRTEFNVHAASDSLRNILDLVKQAKESGSPEWLCRLIEEEFIKLCTRDPNHYLCREQEGKQKMLERAGC